MSVRDPASISSWHAHVYFGADSRDAAWALREVIATELAPRVEIGRFHEKPVGPHPAWTYQLAFDAADPVNTPRDLATEGAKALLKAAGVGSDPGIVQASDAKGFIAAAATRQWAREPKLRLLA